VEQAGVRRVLGQQAVRAAVAEGEDRLAAVALAELAEPRRREVERRVPGDPREAPLPLRADPPGGMEQPVRAIEVFGQPAHLGTDVSLGDRIEAAAVHLDDPPPLHTHVEAAGVRTVERAGAGKDGGGGGRLDRFGHTEIVATGTEPVPDHFGLSEIGQSGVLVTGRCR
jgi:hypothetical protein